MRILIDIGHPGHVHLFRPFALEMQKKGNDILFTCRQKEFEIELLQAAKFKYKSFGRHYRTIIGKIYGVLKFDLQMLISALKFKPDILLSHGSIYAAHVSFLINKPHISLEDTGNMEQIQLYLPFTKFVFTPFELLENLGKKQFRYHSFHELAYLNPKYFSPDKSIYKYLGIKETDKFVILRFVSWNASHDIGHGGFTSEQKDDIVDYLSEKYCLFISSEAKVPDKYEQFLFKMPPETMHNAIAFSDIVISEGATMASEAGVLGTPSIYVNSLRRCYNENMENYGLVFNFQSGKGVLDKIKEIERISDRKNEYKRRREVLLNDKIDLTSFLVWFIENYPKSETILLENPDYQLKFK